jgi:hypothetical protein
MSLKNCPDCHSPISSTADSCPKCGFNLKRQRASRRNVGCLVVFLVVGGIATCSVLTTETASTTTTQTFTKKDGQTGTVDNVPNASLEYNSQCRRRNVTSPSQTTPAMRREDLR